MTKSKNTIISKYPPENSGEWIDTSGKYYQNKVLINGKWIIPQSSGGKDASIEYVDAQDTILQNQITDNKNNIDNHINDTNNPHLVDKNDVGLGNVDNTSDINKPISTATQNALDTKVDKVVGKELSSNDYTDAEKAKLAGLESSKYRGTFVSLVALNAITGTEGEYADVDLGAGLNVTRYIWDATDNIWVTQVGGSSSLTPAQVKTLYESNIDTNAFTDAEKTKLSTLVNYDDTNIVTHINDTNIHTTSAEKSTWNGKQDALVSGVNIKTINGASILGSGDITISGGTPVASSELMVTGINLLEEHIEMNALNIISGTEPTSSKVLVTLHGIKPSKEYVFSANVDPTMTTPIEVFVEITYITGAALTTAGWVSTPSGLQNYVKVPIKFTDEYDNIININIKIQAIDGVSSIGNYSLSDVYFGYGNVIVTNPLNTSLLENKGVTSVFKRIDCENLNIPQIKDAIMQVRYSFSQGDLLKYILLTDSYGSNIITDSFITKWNNNETGSVIDPLEESNNGYIELQGIDDFTGNTDTRLLLRVIKVNTDPSKSTVREYLSEGRYGLSFTPFKLKEPINIENTETTVTLQHNTINTWSTPISTLDFSSSEIKGHYHLKFTISATTPVTITAPTGMVWVNGTPTWSVGTTYEINVLDNIAVWFEYIVP